MEDVPGRDRRCKQRQMGGGFFGSTADSRTWADRSLNSLELTQPRQTSVAVTRLAPDYLLRH